MFPIIIIFIDQQDSVQPCSSIEDPDYQGSSNRLVIIEREVSVMIRDGSVSKMCTSGGRQYKTVPILGLHILVHPNKFN